MPTTKYDLSLYTRDPYVYIGFNHLESSEDEEKEVKALERKKISKTPQDKKRNKIEEKLIGRKRESSKEISKLGVSSRIERANENANKEMKTEKKSEPETNKVENPIKAESSRKNKMSININRTAKNSKEEIKSPKRTLIDKSNPSANTLTQINVKKKITTTHTYSVENKNSENHLKELKLNKTLIENEIFSSGLNIDFKPQMKEEYKLKRTFEVRNSFCFIF